MAYRKFVDKDGRSWEIRDVTRSVWEFVPDSGNPRNKTTVSTPNYENDPYECSNEELQRLLDGAGDTGRRGPPKSPFLD